MKRRKQLYSQAIIFTLIILMLAILVNNLSLNLVRAGLGFDFSWLFRPSGLHWPNILWNTLHLIAMPGLYLWVG